MAWLDKILAIKRNTKLTVSHSKSGDCKIRNAIGWDVISILFFGLFFFYLWKVVDLRLINCTGGATTDFPVFFKGWVFLKSQLFHTGGLTSYLSALLSQFFFYSWTGALVVTLQVWVLAACTGYVLMSSGVPGSRWLRFIPPLLVLAAYNQYSYHFPATQALLTAQLFACLYIAIVSPNRTGPLTPLQKSNVSLDWRALAVFLALSIIVYPIAAGAYLIFGVICIIYELFFRSRLVGIPAIVMVLLVPYLAATWVYNSRVVDAYTELLPVSWKFLDRRTQFHMIWTVYVLYLLTPAAMLVWGLGNPLLRRFRANSNRHCGNKTGMQQHHKAPIRTVRTGGPSEQGTRHSVWSFAAVRRTAQLLVVLGLGIVATVISHNGQKKTLLSVHYYSYQRMWPEVLRTAAGQAANPFVLSAVNRALYHTRRLSTNMFFWPQRPDALLPTGDDKVLMYWGKFDTLIDLGLINLAEKNLIECMEAFGEQPIFLQRLALINMTKGEIETARVFLGALNRTLFYSTWAGRYLKLLQTDPGLSTDADVQQIRAVCLKTNFNAAFFDKEKLLTALLQGNGRNRMAFEYLMAWYLVNKQVDKVTEGIRYMNELNYTEIPRLYQEAICIYAYGHQKPIQLLGRTVDPRIRKGIEQFSQTFNRYKRDKRAAFPELAATYSGSYFLYHIYGLASLK